VCRLAFSDEDKQARDKVTGWLHELGLDVTTDRFGNTVGVRAGREDGPAVMTGLHIDTVETGGAEVPTMGHWVCWLVWKQ
jgi:N-carbamoyl-L-amino-acid hydrolase